MRPSLALLVLALAGAACSAPVAPGRDPFTATGETIAMSGGDGGAANACFTCHGMEGEGDGVTTPRLAGLDSGYLQKQLVDYASGLRADDTMTPIARWLDDDDQRAVAAWYAALPVADAGAAATPAPQVYTRACAVCHGPHGEGVGAGGPALAGQPAGYIADQLVRWQKAERRNDPRGIMAAAAAPLAASEIRAISAWLERQAASRRPASGAASASAAATASARLAASHGIHRPGR